MRLLFAPCILLCLLLAACSTEKTLVSHNYDSINEDKASVSKNNEPPIEGIILLEDESLEAQLLNKIIAKEVDCHFLADEITIKDISILETGTGSFAAESNAEYMVMEYRDPGFFSYWGACSYYICIVNGGKPTFHYLGDELMHFGNTLLADIDGDGLDEIIISGGGHAIQAGFSVNMILKWDGQSFLTLLLANGTNQKEDQINYPEFSFDLSLGQDFAATIKSTITGYEKTFHAVNDLDIPSAMYRADGTINTEHPSYGSRFESEAFFNIGYGLYEISSIKTVDYDNDGIAEIMASKKFCFNFDPSVSVYATVLGQGYALLRYSTSEKTFNVIDSAFIPINEYDWEKDYTVDQVFAK